MLVRRTIIQHPHPPFPVSSSDVRSKPGARCTRAGGERLRLTCKQACRGRASVDRENLTCEASLKQQSCQSDSTLSSVVFPPSLVDLFGAVVSCQGNDILPFFFSCICHLFFSSVLLFLFLFLEFRNCKLICWHLMRSLQHHDI